MARFDVYPNPDPLEAEQVPYFLDVQSDYIQGMTTRVLVPLWRTESFPNHISELNPQVEINGALVIMDTAAVGAVTTRALKRAVANVGDKQFVIQNALDILFGGY